MLSHRPSKNSTNSCHRRLAIMGHKCKLGVLAALAFIASPASAGCPFLSGEKVRYNHACKCGRTHAPDVQTTSFFVCFWFTPAVGGGKLNKFGSDAKIIGNCRSVLFRRCCCCFSTQVTCMLGESVFRAIRSYLQYSCHLVW